MLARYANASKRLAWSLRSPPADVRAVDEQIEAWLVAYATAMQPPYRKERQVPGLHDTDVDRALSGVVDGLEDGARLYAWAKLRLVHDSMFSGLRLGVTGPRLSKHTAAIAPDRISAEAAVAFARFFIESSQDTYVSDELWTRFKGSGLLSRGTDAGIRDELLAFFVALAAARFFFSYKPITRVLAIVQSTDVQTLAALRRFEDIEDRGCTAFVGEVVRCVEPLVADRHVGAVARSVILWFAGAQKRAADAQWNAKREELERTVADDTLRTLSWWIRRRPHKRYFGDKPFRDDLFCLLWKSASWYLGLAVDLPRPLRK